MMRRLASVILVLAAFGLAVGLWSSLATAQFPSPVVPMTRILGLHTQAANVTHWGALFVSCFGTTGAAESCGGSGGSGDAVNVFHQSTIRHISSVTHITGSLFLTNQAGTAVTVTGTALDVNCTGCAAASVVGVTHISSALHIAGTINGARFHIQGVGIPGQAHGGVLTVQGVTGGVPLPVSLTSGGDAVNVFHQSTVRHISSLTHVVIVDWQRWAHIQVSQSGAWIVTATHQGGQWNNAHTTSVTHVRGTVFIGDKSDPTRNANVTHAGALAVHIASIGPNNGEPTFCHSTAAFVLHAGTNVAPVIHVSAGWRVAICTVVAVASVANDVSLVEGNDANGDINGNNSAYSGGCGARIGAQGSAWTSLIGGQSRGLPFTANGGVSTPTAVPWLKTATRGNSVCIVKQTGGGHVTGTITYSGYR